MTDQLERLLEYVELAPPQDFRAHLMARLQRMPRVEQTRAAPRWLPWAAIVCGALLGVGELASFMLSAWIAVPGN
jgi:hypothetical protein